MQRTAIAILLLIMRGHIKALALARAHSLIGRKEIEAIFLER
jgi:hypothetical protein